MTRPFAQEVPVDASVWSNAMPAATASHHADRVKGRRTVFRVSSRNTVDGDQQATDSGTGPLVLGLLAASAITTGLVQFRRDGYRRTPTLLH